MVPRPTVERRTAGVVIALLLVVNVALLASVLVPVSPATPLGSADDEALAVEAFAEGTIEGTIVVDGEVAIEIEGAVVEDGPRYQLVREPDLGTETHAFQPSPDGPVLRRSVLASSADLDRLVDSIESNPDRSLVSVERDGERHVVVSVEDRPAQDLADAVFGSASLFTNSLGVVAYDSVKDGESIVYQPRADWYADGAGYRVTDTSGAVRVDPESGTVRSANVSWTITEPAPTGIHYLLNRSDSFEQRIEYRAAPGPTNVSRPDWADPVTVNG